MNDREPFELALADYWRKRDFNSWNSTRLVYADWLEERNDPLAEMARAPFEAEACMIRLNFRDPAEVVMSRWILTLSLGQEFIRQHQKKGPGKTATHELLRPRWRGLNGQALFGIDPFCMRFRGFYDWLHRADRQQAVGLMYVPARQAIASALADPVDDLFGDHAANVARTTLSLARPKGRATLSGLMGNLIKPGVRFDVYFKPRRYLESFSKDIHHHELGFPAMFLNLPGP